MAVAGFKSNSARNVGPNSGGRVLMTVNAMGLVPAPLLAAAWKDWLRTRHSEYRFGLGSLYGTEPRPERAQALLDVRTR